VFLFRDPLVMVADVLLFPALPAACIKSIQFAAIQFAAITSWPVCRPSSAL